MSQFLVEKIQKALKEGKYQKMVKTITIGDGKQTTARPVIMMWASDVNGEKYFSDEDVLFVSRNSIEIVDGLETECAYISREPVDWTGNTHEDAIYLEGYIMAAEEIDRVFAELPEQMPAYRI